MEYRYEDQSPASRTGPNNKPYIDFYRQNDANPNHNNQDQHHQISQGAIYNEGYTQDNKIIVSENLLKNKQDYEHKFFTQNKHDTNIQNQVHDQRKEEYKKVLQDKQALKRKSVESAEAINRQNEQRQVNQPKSALNNYPTHGASQPHSGQQTLKQISKNKIERDYVMEQVFQGPSHSQQHSISQQQQSKRSLAKSQSQNRLVLVSPESMMNKGNHYQDMYIIAEGMEAPDKSSISDKSMADRSRSGNPTDPLFKQHHLNSTTQQHNNQLKSWQLKLKNNNLLSHITTKDCTYCNKTGGIHSHSYIPQPQCSAIFCGKDQLSMYIQADLSKKYSQNRDYYNLKIVNDLIYNENTHIVSIFKDYLILDDINEFLKRSYTTSETKTRLPKLCSFYDKYSQVFPNYVILPESKYMFKNIQRKQKLIDEQYQLQEEIARRKEQTLMDEDRLFNSKFYNSVYKLNDLSMSIHQYEDQAKTISSLAGRPSKLPTRIDQMKIDELVDRFLLKDSESNIQLITTTGLDFSGFTQNQSTFIQDKAGPITKTNKQVVASKPMQQTKNQAGVRKESLQKKPITLVTNNQVAQKKQKVSFNNPQQQKPSSVPKIDTMKATMNNITGSTKTTPRIQRPVVVDNIKDQASPATKEALESYLQQCQIENNDQLQLLVLDNGNDYEFSQLQSPQVIGGKVLGQTTSQTALSQQLGSSLNGNNRQMMKSQCVIPTIQLGQNKEITNLKKTSRLSGNQFQSIKPATMQQKKQNISPMPMTNMQQQQLTQGSRNFVTNSTQKSIKSINSHAKYLSGGADQYQKLLSNPYATSETVQSNNYGSSSKKLQPQRSKQDIIMETFQSRVQNQAQEIDHMDNDGAITGEDCDDGIADERFASPDIFATDDNNGRKSIQQRQAFGNPLLLTSGDDNRLLSQCNNFDQIKKHLEQYITTSQQQDNSHKKQFTTMSSEKFQQQDIGFNKLQMASSSSNLNDVNNSRNGTKQVESLKSKIRGVFEVDSSLSQSANKTPNKSSTISKKSQVTVNQQPTILGNNRMSIESKDMMQLMATASNPGCLSSTSAAGRTLSFAQFTNNQNNYRSITNMQQRKNSSSKHQQESSVESKRLSQNRQSFKDLSQQQDKLKRCATGKTLSINDVNQQTFGYINSNYPHQQTSTTLKNPTFISSSSNQASNKLYQTHHQQQHSLSGIQANNNNNSQQAANTVRVMTPSYSLASLSKIISPTQSTSPITMTVTLATQGRKQNAKKYLQNQHQHNPSMGHLITSASHQNFVLTDKSSKVIGSSKPGSNVVSSKSTRSIINPKPQQQIQQKGIQTKLQQSSSQETFQITPRGMNPQAQQMMPKPPNEISNLSCTISTENNSTAKAVESKHPKFMKTIEEYNVQPPQYNNMLSASMGHRKSGTGLSGSISQAQLDVKTKQKIQTVMNSNQASIKRTNGTSMGMTLSQSGSISHIKSPSQHIQTKKQQPGRY